MSQKLDEHNQCLGFRQGGLLASSDQYRTKVEGRQLCDLGTTIPEKYGPETSWKMSLRNNYSEQHIKLVGKLKKDDVLRASVESRKSAAGSDNGEGGK